MLLLELLVERKLVGLEDGADFVSSGCPRSRGLPGSPFLFRVIELLPRLIVDHIEFRDLLVVQLHPVAHLVDAAFADFFGIHPRRAAAVCRR